MQLPRRAWVQYRSDGLTSTLVAVKRYWIRQCLPYLRGGRSGRYLFRAATAARYRIQRVRYAAPARPYRRIRVDPDLITHVNRYRFDRELGLGQLRGGAWDRPDRRTPIEDEWIYTGLRQRFEDGYTWNETVYYTAARERFANGNSFWGYDDIDEFRRVRCSYVDDLFEAMQDTGYRPCTERAHDVPASDKRTDTYHHRFDPLVTIGRHGEVFLADGLHRFAIARILGLESIPLNIVGRHRKWQQVRDAVARAATRPTLDAKYERYLDHPDLDDIGLD